MVVGVYFFICVGEKSFFFFCQKLKKMIWRFLFGVLFFICILYFLSWRREKQQKSQQQKNIIKYIYQYLIILSNYYF